MSLTLMACPFCGSRPLEQFALRGVMSDDPNLMAGLYERGGRADESLEHWQHVAGCRAWLAVRRNPSTGTLLAVHFLGASPS